jgi:probable F420-dependent oxidoreductase
VDLSGVGVWSSALRYGDTAEAADSAAELEALGFTALWIPDIGGRVLGSVAHLLASTQRIVIATGVLNIWMNNPTDVAASHAALTSAHGDRFLLGIGCSHAPIVDSKQPGRYRKPLAANRSFLDGLDTAEQPVPAETRVLAALGPRMLQLAGTRARGAHTYLVTPEHTRQAREALGEGPLLVPEQTVLLVGSREEARAVGNDWLRSYLALPNYANNLIRLGFTDDDLTTASNRLFDALIAWGDDESILRRINEHRAAGADHVCVQLLTADPLEFAREGWRRLAAALT